jgi:NADH:ubiquinone oxidoreductase subunit 6 (subunit J)
VVMMLDLKDVKSLFSFNYYILTALIFTYVINFFLIKNFYLKDFNYVVKFEKVMDLSFNVDIFGQFLYNYYSSCFLIAGIILLLALIGAIVLTLHYKSKRKNEIVSRQLSRTNVFLSFFE